MLAVLTYPQRCQWQPVAASAAAVHGLRETTALEARLPVEMDSSALRTSVSVCCVCTAVDLDPAGNYLEDAALVSHTQVLDNASAEVQLDVLTARQGHQC